MTFMVRLPSSVRGELHHYASDFPADQFAFRNTIESHGFASDIASGRTLKQSRRFGPADEPHANCETAARIRLYRLDIARTEKVRLASDIDVSIQKVRHDILQDCLPSEYSTVIPAMQLNWIHNRQICAETYEASHDS